VSAPYVADEWATVLACASPQQRMRRVIPPGRLFSSPYLEPPKIVEGETGQPLSECFACGAFREGVRDIPLTDEGAMGEVCAACVARADR
jgi:hypothetical protein